MAGKGNRFPIKKLSK